MPKYSGQISKLITHLQSPISYILPIGKNEIHLNNYLEQTLALEFSGEIRCIECNNKIKKTFMQGYCYPCFITSPKTSECILRPELCRAHEGEARDMKWAEEHCLQDQYVYLSLTSNSMLIISLNCKYERRRNNKEIDIKKYLVNISLL